MKKVLSFIILLVLCSCNSSFKFSDYHKQLSASQLSNSPTSKKRLSNRYLSSIRKLYFDNLQEFRENNSENKIVVVESYDVICSNCPPSIVTIYNNLSFTIYYVEFEKKGFLLREIEKKSVNENESKFIIPEDVKRIYLDSEQKNWNSNIETYETSICFDGSISFYNVIFPDNHIESIRIRCWSPKK